jgi:hypothetical protein
MAGGVVAREQRVPPGFEPGAMVRVVHGKPWKKTSTSVGVVEDWRDGVLVLRRTFSPGGTYDSIGAPKRAGDHGTVEVAEGGRVLRRAYYRADGELIGELYNIQTPARLRRGEVSYVDLEVDVARWPDGRVEVVDLHDLSRAESAGHIKPGEADQARKIAERLATILREGGSWREAEKH